MKMAIWIVICWIKFRKTRKREISRKQMGVDFGIEEKEVYLGDVIGGDVTEAERYDDILDAIEKTGQRWNREDIGVFGQALVANTLLLGKIGHRASVNTLSQQVRKMLKEKVRAFFWKGAATGKVKWEVLLLL